MNHSGEISHSDAIVSRYAEYCGENNIPGGRSLSYFREDNIFEHETLDRINVCLSKIPGESKEDDVRKNLIAFHMHEINYSEDYRVLESRELVPHAARFYTRETPSDEMRATIEELRIIVLERFAKELELTGKHHIWMNCVRYCLPEGVEKDVVKWHTDLTESWTMVTMMTDSEGEKGWTGGDILLAPSEMLERPKTDPVPVPIEDQKVAISHFYNSAIFFHNYKTVHTVSPLTGTSNPSKAKKPKSKVRKFLQKFNIGDSSSPRMSERIIWTCQDHCPDVCRNRGRPLSSSSTSTSTSTATSTTTSTSDSFYGLHLQGDQ